MHTLYLHNLLIVVHFLAQATIHCTFAAGPAPVLLGTAGNFAVLAKTGVSTVPNSAISE
jgi:hypothetical protein